MEAAGEEEGRRWGWQSSVKMPEAWQEQQGRVGRRGGEMKGWQVEVGQGGGRKWDEKGTEMG